MTKKPLSDGALSRRAFIRQGTLYMLAGAALPSSAASAVSVFDDRPALNIALLTDVHYADTDDRGARNYRESLPKMEQAIEKLNSRKISFAVHGGDLIDALPDPDEKSERRFLQRIDKEFSRLKTERHYVLGNHCIFSITKPEFLETVHRPKSYYSFDKGPFHFVVLDACFRKDGVAYGRRNFEWTDTEIPAEERDWLAADLKATKRKTIVFVHQRLDLPDGAEDGVHSSAGVRAILEQSGRVQAVFMGHSHVNEYRMTNGIHYCTLDAVVGGVGDEKNAYSVLEVFSDCSLKLDGFCKHEGHPFALRNA